MDLQSLLGCNLLKSNYFTFGSSVLATINKHIQSIIVILSALVCWLLLHQISPVIPSNPGFKSTKRNSSELFTASEALTWMIFLGETVTNAEAKKGGRVKIQCEGRLQRMSSLLKFAARLTAC